MNQALNHWIAFASMILLTKPARPVEDICVAIIFTKKAIFKREIINRVKWKQFLDSYVKA